MPILYTLEELLNPYPKESEEYEKTNHRIKIIWDEEEKNTIILEVSNCNFGPMDIITASQKPNTPILMKFKKNPFAKRLP